MAVRFCQLVVNAREPAALARWWAEIPRDPEGNEFCILAHVTGGVS